MNLQRLDKAICESKLSEAEIGRRIGRKRQSINSYRKGNTTPNENTIKQLADVLNVDVLWLLGYDNTEKEIKECLDRLNEDGHNKILEYAKDISLIDKYKQNERDD